MRELTGRPLGRVTGWDTYLESFHHQHAGITEDVLRRSHNSGITAYEWIAEDISSGQRVLDIGCGSAPIAEFCDRYVGLDRSPRELERARRDHPNGQFVMGDARHLSFVDDDFNVVTCSMMLMLVDDAEAVLQEIARVLRPGGRLIVLLPGGIRPLELSDYLVYARMLTKLRITHIPFPHVIGSRKLERLLQNASFSHPRSESRRFAFPIRTPSDAQLFVDSLYLPRTRNRQRGRAISYISTWRRPIGIPLRKVVTRLDR